MFKKLLTLTLALSATFLLSLALTTPTAQAATAISSCTDLQNMQNNLAGDYYLTQDIDCSYTAAGDQGNGDIWTDIKGFNPIMDFAGFLMVKDIKFLAYI